MPNWIREKRAIEDLGRGAGQLGRMSEKLRLSSPEASKAIAAATAALLSAFQQFKVAAAATSRQAGREAEELEEKEREQSRGAAPGHPEILAKARQAAGDMWSGSLGGM